MHFVFIIITFIAVTANNTGINIEYQDDEDRIFNGKPAYTNQFPYHVAIFRSNGKYRCGGALISKQWVLTAAHCLTGMTEATIILGAINISSITDDSQQVIKSSRLIVHPYFKLAPISNDIGLIKLDSEAVLTKSVKLVDLPKKNDTVKLGQKLTASGFGKTTSDGPRSKDLMYVQIKVVHRILCTLRFGIISKEVLCLRGEDKKATCQGDSGSPIVERNFLKKTLRGVVSFGSRSGCHQGYPFGITSVEPYLEWIATTTKQ